MKKIIFLNIILIIITANSYPVTIEKGTPEDIVKININTLEYKSIDHIHGKELVINGPSGVFQLPGFSFHWDDFSIDIKYQNTTPTEAARIFFEQYLKGYIEKNYLIIPKDTDLLWVIE